MIKIMHFPCYADRFDKKWSIVGGISAAEIGGAISMLIFRRCFPETMRGTE